MSTSGRARHGAADATVVDSSIIPYEATLSRAAQKELAAIVSLSVEDAALRTLRLAAAAEARETPAAPRRSAQPTVPRRIQSAAKAADEPARLEGVPYRSALRKAAAELKADNRGRDEFLARLARYSAKKQTVRVQTRGCENCPVVHRSPNRVCRSGQAHRPQARPLTCSASSARWPFEAARKR